MRKDINSLVEFKGKVHNGIEITADQIKSRTLEVVVPNLGNIQQRNALNKAINYGQKQGVEVKIVVYTE